MGRNDVTFSDEQRKAVADAMLAGNSSTDVVALASTGDLGLPPFPIGEATVRRIGAEAREEAMRNPQRLAAITDRVLSLTEESLDRLEGSAKRGRLSNPDLSALKKLMGLAEAATRAGKVATSNGHPPSRNGAETASRATDLLTPPDLLTRLAQEPTNGPEPPDPPGTT